MPVVVAVPAFLAGALVSLATSWVLVSRLERVGERLGLSEALLGIVAALAADAPEVTAAVTAIAGHQQRLGAGVIIGSNVFNLAALLGLGAVVAGRIRLHRKVVVLGGTVAMCVAIVCLVVVTGVVPPPAGLVIVLVTVGLYAVVLGAGDGGLLARLRFPGPWIGWLRSAVAEEEAELEEAIRPARARRQDVVVAALALLVVVVASVTMERAASALGTRFAVPEIVVGGLVLAAVTSLPNAVAAVYLAARGRGAATLSIALNSNTLNVVFGLLLPAAVIGLGRPSGQATLIAAWYLGLTAVLLAFAWRDRGVFRKTGILVIAAYAVFAGCCASDRAHAGPLADSDRGRRGEPPSCSVSGWYPAAARVPAAHRPARPARCQPQNPQTSSGAAQQACRATAARRRAAIPRYLTDPGPGWKANRWCPAGRSGNSGSSAWRYLLPSLSLTPCWATASY